LSDRVPGPNAPTTEAQEVAAAQATGAAPDAAGPARADGDVARSHVFFAMASHELRTPLQALGLNLTMLRERVANSADEVPKAWLADRLERTQRLVHQMERLVEGLLNVSEISAGRFALALEEADLSELAHAVVARAADRLRWSGCHCTVDAPAPVRARVDRLRVELVLENLLANAMKYAHGSPIAVRVAAEGARAVLAVADGGPGIAPEAQARIFERFERGPGAGSVAGFGLGLWIVRTVVEAHGGAAAVESAPGAGATFTVTLPRAEASAAPAR
jgi:signal transduction histidine kinase